MNSYQKLAVGTIALSAFNVAYPSDFTTIGETVVAESIWDMQAFDFNNDGVQDILVQTPKALVVYRGDETAEFTEVSRISYPISYALPISIADYNSDGNADILYDNAYYGDGSGGFTPAPLLCDGSNYISTYVQTCTQPALHRALSCLTDPITTDVNDDGAVDMVCPYNRRLDGATDNDFGATTLRNYGVSGLYAETISISSAEGDGFIYPTHVASGDTNNDGRIDAVYSYTFANVPAYITEYQVIGSFVNRDSAFRYESSWETTDFFDTNNRYASNRISSLNLADTNNDGNLDLLVTVTGYRDTPEPFLSVHFGDGTGTFSPSGMKTFLPYYRLTDIEVADIDLDGKQDLILAHDNTGEEAEPGYLVVMRGTGEGRFEAARRIHPDDRNSNAGIGYVEVTDFDGDGKPDIAFSSGWDYGRITVKSMFTTSTDESSGEAIEVDVNCNYDDADLHNGWGWNSLTSTSCAPIQESACVDTDGDGWGWNGVSTCLPDDVAPRVTACIDTDGDGWGWDGSNSCIF